MPPSKFRRQKPPKNSANPRAMAWYRGRGRAGGLRVPIPFAFTEPSLRCGVPERNFLRWPLGSRLTSSATSRRFLPDFGTCLASLRRAKATTGPVQICLVALLYDEEHNEHAAVHAARAPRGVQMAKVAAISDDCDVGFRRSRRGGSYLSKRAETVGRIAIPNPGSECAGRLGKSWRDCV